MKSLPKVAVVILNYNGIGHLKNFLPTVVKSTYDHLDIYVADNGSTDKSIAFVKEQYPTINCIVLDENYGFAGGYNRALKEIEADYYVLLNSDVEVPENWIQEPIEMMEANPKIAAAQPSIMQQADKQVYEYAGAAGGFMDYLGYPFCRGRIFETVEKELGQYQYPQEIFWASGAAFFVRAELYHQFGGLDSDFVAHMEEIDLCWRFRRAGYQIMSVPMSRVYHVGGGTLSYHNPHKIYLNFRNALWLLLKNERGAKLIWLLPYRLLLDGIAGFRFLTQFNFGGIWSIIKAHFVVYGTLFKTLKKRKSFKQKLPTLTIGEMPTQGIYHKSIVWAYFILKRKMFKDL